MITAGVGHAEKMPPGESLTSIILDTRVPLKERGAMTARAAFIEKLLQLSDYHPGANWNPHTQFFPGRWNGCAR